MSVLCGFQNCSDGFLFGCVDEAAGVDDYDVGAVWRRGAVPGTIETARKRIGVGLILWAAERLDEVACGDGVSGSW